ncbi:SDR family NAD(P)-dependent oxidoreductase [Marinobacter sp. NP-4(2019)]|uniref:SDR family NAD(P)-dependent oxidoreductase n=1 Tax=Marinobacter sp. NP-4(2019) TaxID=2488665 RepID=UPI000FC3ED0F|nr:SDR family NAD(P)-dependent oxidoreductase [Marinobacter sp. NP-4(2019)]AZT85549.1 SDR family NAD(P)-dependent oxidoreductase [Marinobacter sp. NP-4(2019)]
MSAAPVAVITGAGRRLGYEVSLALVERGYRVFALHRTHTEEVDHLIRQGVTALQVDLADPDAVQARIDDIVRATTSVSLLVNNASAFETDAENPQERPAQAARLFQTNSTAPMQLMHGLAPALETAAREYGRPSLIVNITDIFTERPNPLYGAYCASKAALANLTLSYAALLAPDVRVNAIMPGPIGFLPRHTDSQRQQVLSETLLAREGGFHSVVMQVLALLDNDFITGAQIPVDGGRRLAQGMARHGQGSAD